MKSAASFLSWAGERAVKNPFTDHPHAAGESYGQHFGVAMSYSLRLFAAAGAAFIHALLPFCFRTTASGMVKAMHASMTSRVAAAPLVAPTAVSHPGE